MKNCDGNSKGLPGFQNLAGLRTGRPLVARSFFSIRINCCDLTTVCLAG